MSDASSEADGPSAPRAVIAAGALDYRAQQSIGRLRIDRSDECSVITIVTSPAAFLTVLLPVAINVGWVVPMLLLNWKSFRRGDPENYVLLSIAVISTVFAIASNLFARLHPPRFEIRWSGIVQFNRNVKSIQRIEIYKSIIYYACIERCKTAAWPFPRPCVVIHSITGKAQVLFSGSQEERKAFLDEILARMNVAEPADISLFPRSLPAKNCSRSIKPSGFEVTVQPKTSVWRTLLVAIFLLLPLSMLGATFAITQQMAFIPFGRNATLAWVVGPIFWLLGIGLLTKVQHHASRSTQLSVMGRTVRLVEESIFTPCDVEWPDNDVKFDVHPHCIRLNLADGQHVEILKHATPAVREWVYRHIVAERDRRHQREQRR